MPYVAVKLDVVRSRRVPDRQHLQDRLLAAVEVLNARFPGVIAARFVVTHGDEVQGLLASPCPELVTILEGFYDALHPHRVRAGIGLGELHTRLQPTAIGMDGPAWHAATDAIDTAARERKFVQFRGFGETQDALYTALLNLLLWQRQRWSPQQRQIIARLGNGTTQAEIARELGVTAAAVSERLQAAGWKHYAEGQRVLQRLLAGAAAKV